MLTVAMHCPKCEKAFDVPAELAGEGHRCYTCGVPIEPTRTTDGPHRRGHREFAGGRLQPIAIGAAIGAVVTVAFGLIGGPIGSVVIGAVSGAVLGFVLLALIALFALEDAGLVLDGPRISILAKVFIALGGVLGACGVTGSGGALDPVAVLVLGAIGGLVAGGLIGHRVAGGRSP